MRLFRGIGPGRIGDGLQRGRRGGERVKAKYGSEFYEEIGRKGGEATKSKYGPSFYEVIGQKGGQRPKRKATAS